jgi:glucosamine-6-phosphate deaminase
MQQTITGWPGGKPSENLASLSPNERIKALSYNDQVTGTTTRNLSDYIGRSLSTVNTKPGSPHPHVSNDVYPKTVLIFSPHPDDDVISMGGTLIRLVEQGHRVHVAYQTSGNIAVWDDDVQRFSNFVTRYVEEFGFTKDAAEKALTIENGVDDFLGRKKAGHPDNDTIRKVKGLIRETEARNGARYCGVKKEDIHFLYLPFYETGEAKKKDLSEVDVAIVQKLLEDTKPHQIYAAGDLSDPHGTHRVCLMAIFAALHKVKTQEWFQSTQVWLYRGAWQEWEPHMIQMAIPMSPDELLQKRYAIYKHQSQKDPAPFPGSDPREFWQRSEARNRATAQIYDKLGLADYEAMEAFVRYDINRPNDVPL